MASLADLEKAFPEIPWRTPIVIRTFSGDGGLGCRLCIAQVGIKGKNVCLLPQTMEEFREHWQRVHTEVQMTEVEVEKLASDLHNEVPK